MPASLLHRMGPLEGWYDTEESDSPWKISGTFGGRERTSLPEEYMEARHCQSSWIPTSAGRKRVHREIASKTSSAIVPREQITNMAGGSPLQHLLPSSLTGGWNEQTADVLHVSASHPSEVKGLHATNFSGRVTRFEDVDTTIVDDPSRIYRENNVSNFAALVLPTDLNSTGGNTGQLKITNDVANDLVLMNGWDPRRNTPEYRNEKMLRNQETLFAAETSNANGRNLWSTRFCTLVRDTKGSLSSPRSASSEGRKSQMEVQMEQSSREEVPNLIPDRHEHMQGAREAVTSLGDHGVQAAEINRSNAFLEQSQLSEFDRHSATFDTKSTFLPSISFLEDNILQSSKFPLETGMLTTGTQNSEIPLHNASGLNVSGRGAETLSTLSVAIAAIQPEQLALHLPTGSPLSILPPANKHNLLDGSSESSQAPRFPLHLTPPLQHPPQPMEQMVEVHQSFTMTNQKQNGCLWTSPAFQENLHSKQVNAIGQGRVQQQQNSSWQQVITELEHDDFYKQPQQSLPQGSALDMGMLGAGSHRSGSPDWTSTEAVALQQLQASIIQLDVGTRMSIRDALFRLANSAKNRRNCRALNYQDLAEPDSVTISSCVTGDGPCDGSRCEAETQTNHFDRSIANLLFSTGPLRRYGPPTAYKCQSISQLLPGAQNGLWSWFSTGVIGNNWSSSSCNYAESLGVAPRMPSGNLLNSTWAASPLENGPRALSTNEVDSPMDHDSFRCTDKSGSPDSYQPLDMQADRLNISLPSSMQCHALSSSNGVLNFDRSASPSQYTVIPEGMRPEGSMRGEGKREINLDIAQTFANGSNLVKINYQPTLMPRTKDLGNDIAANAPSLQEEFRVVNKFHDGAGNLESKFPLESRTSHFTHPDEYGGMTVRTAGHMFGDDMNSVTTSHRTVPSGKVEPSTADLWHDH